MTLPTKLAVVAVVLTAGSGAALCFRRPAAEPSVTAPSGAVFPLRTQEGSVSTGNSSSLSAQGVPMPDARGTAAVASVEPPPKSDLPPVAKSSLIPPQLPPAFTSDGLGQKAQGSDLLRAMPPVPAPLPDLRGPSSVDVAMPSAAPRAPVATAPQNPSRAEPAPWRSHTVVDGDTLSGLATRYLGSAGRYAEILEANRTKLRSADMLPVGIVLRIPPQSVAAPPVAPAAESARPFPHLVPIPAGALTSRDAQP